MNLKAPQVLAADTNVGMDLAQGNDWVVDAIATIHRRLPESLLLVPPTVSEEMAWLAVHAEETSVPKLPMNFFAGIAPWDFNCCTQSHWATLTSRKSPNDCCTQPFFPPMKPTTPEYLPKRPSLDVPFF